MKITRIERKTEDGEPITSMPIEWERRGENYVVKLIDGEIEYTEDEFIEYQNKMNGALEYLETWIEKYGHNEWIIGNTPKNADTYLRLDHYFKNMALASFKIIDSGIDEKNVFLDIYFILDSLKNKFQKDAINPYSKDNEVMEYCIKHLNLIIEEVKIYERLVEARKEKLTSERLKKRFYENAKWERIISDWNSILASGHADFIGHDGKETFSFTKQEINEKALKYFEYYKEVFKKRTEFLIDIESELREEYYNQTRFFASTKDGYLNCIMVKDNELVFNEGRFFGNAYTNAENPYTKESHKIRMTDSSIKFNWDEFLENFKKYNFVLKFRGYELLPNIIGKSYYCSYLKKQILAFEEKPNSLETASKQLNINPKKVRTIIKKRYPTFLEFFHKDQRRVDLFFKALKDLGAVDNNNNWIFTPDNSICNCLEALFILSKNNGYSLVNHSYESKYSNLHKMISAKITIKCTYGNFKKWGNDMNQINTFKKKFKNSFKEYMN